MVLYCIVLCCAVLCCIVLYCIVLYCIVLYCTVLCRRWCPEEAALFSLSGEAHVGDFKDAGLWAFDALNGNCFTTAQTYLGRTAADACLLQEMRLSAANCEQAERTAAHDGWTLTVRPAMDTAAGSTSAGVAVAVRSHFGLARSPGMPTIEIDLSRVIVRWLGAVCRGGIHLVM